MAAKKLFLAFGIVIVSAMCLEGLLSTNISLTATRQGTSDTFDVSLDFTAVDENGTAIEGATVYCRGFEKNTERAYGTTDAKGKFSYTTSISLGPGNCPKKDMVVHCYAKKGDTKTETVSDTVELTCYQTPTQTPTLAPTSTPDCPSLVPCAPPLSTRVKGYDKRGCPMYECVPLPTPTGGMCAQVITAAVSPEGNCIEFRTPCDVPAGWTVVGGSCPAVTPAGCGDTHTGVWPATCGSICSAAGKSCVKQSSCGGGCVNQPCDSSCGGSGDINGCTCS